MTDDDLEARLRAALAARTAQVTPDDLRPSAPPTLRAARSPAFVLAVRALVIATSLALVAFAFLPGRAPVPEPQAPSSPSSGPSCAPVVVYPGGTASPSSYPCTPPYTEGPGFP